MFRNPSIGWWSVALIALLSTGDLSAANGDATGTSLAGASPSSISFDTFSGAASSSYGFLVPPGRGGIQPDLTIAYNSGSAAPTMLGRGWDLAIPFIQRNTRKGQPTFTWSDTFSIKWTGKLIDLVMICDPSSGCPQGVREFRTEVERYLRIKSYSFPPQLTYWEVEDGNGRKYQFGNTGNGGAWAQVNDDQWALNRIEDTHGNYLTVDWLINSATLYPMRIQYTGNSRTGLAPANLVEFGYE